MDIYQHMWITMWITLVTQLFQVFWRIRKMQNEANELLTKAKELLKEETTKISYETWIKNLEWKYRFNCFF